jgi:hypothetical protein
MNSLEDYAKDGFIEIVGAVRLLQETDDYKINKRGINVVLLGEMLEIVKNYGK